MKIHGPDASPSVQHDRMDKKLTPLDKLKSAISRGKKNEKQSQFDSLWLEILNPNI